MPLGSTMFCCNFKSRCSVKGKNDSAHRVMNHERSRNVTIIQKTIRIFPRQRVLKDLDFSSFLHNNYFRYLSRVFIHFLSEIPVLALQRNICAAKHTPRTTSRNAGKSRIAPECRGRNRNLRCSPSPLHCATCCTSASLLFFVVSETFLKIIFD